MVHVIEYISKKWYMWDTKIGRQWRVPELDGKEKVKEEDQKMAEVEDKRKEEEEVKAGHSGIQEIHKFQKSTHFLTRKLPFVRWVRKIAQEQWGDLWFQA